MQRQRCLYPSGLSNSQSPARRVIDVSPKIQSSAAFCCSYQVEMPKNASKPSQAIFAINCINMIAINVMNPNPYLDGLGSQNVISHGWFGYLH